MPLIYTENVWRALYRRSLPIRKDTDGNVTISNPPLTYGRAYEFMADIDPDTLQPVVGTTAKRHAKRRDWLTAGGLDNNARVIEIGCAFGFTLEYLIDAGITDVWGIEPSPYVWANTQDIRADVLPRIVNATVGVDSVSAIQSLFAGAGMGNPRRGDWILDSDAISSQQDDAGIAAFLTGCEELLQGNARGRIVHLVTPLDPERGPGDSALLWKTMPEWEAYAPDHTWVNLRDGAVF